MIDNILPILKFCSWVLVISFINGIRYLFLKKRLKLIYEEHREEIHKAIRCNRIKFSALFVKPLETGNEMLDLLLFKIHRSAMWFVFSLFFYGTSIIFYILVIAIIKKVSLVG
ncbi:hypothetical protein ACFL3G_10320 [Planctomycetota bacterium]